MKLVTGGNGFIGKKILECLKSDFISLDPTYLTNDKCKYAGTTLDTEILRDIFSQHKIETVLHLGMTSLSKEAKKDSSKAKSSIIDGTLNLLNLMNEYKVNRLIFVSTSLVYGEYSDRTVSENDHCRPVEPYGKLKYEAEQLVQGFCIENDIEFIIIRPTSVYGKNDDKMRVVSLLIDKARNGEAITINGRETAMDFTYVDDVVEAILLAADNKSVKNEIFNISRGKRRKLTELAKILTEYFPEVKVEIKDKEKGLPSKGQLDIKKAQELLNFSPKVELEDGLERIVRGY